MATLMPDQLDDFVNLTLSNYKRREWVDIALDLQEYTFANRFMKNRKKKKFDAGADYFKFKVQYRNLNTARVSEMFAVDNPGLRDVSIEGKVPWTKQDFNWSYDVDEEFFQTDREKIVDELLMREHAAENGFWELMEEKLWSMPTSSSERPRPPFGVPYWIVKDSTTTPGGAFNGGNPSGFTSGAADIDSATYTNYKNWTAGYSAVAQDDLIPKWEKACDFTKFLNPHKYPGAVAEGSDWAFFTTYTVLAALRPLLRAQNDNLGGDLSRYSSAMFRGNEVIWVPYLQANDSTHPVYGINFNSFFYYVKKGRDMVRHAPKMAPHQHTVREVYTDHWGNFACMDRRRNFVISQ